MGNMADETTFDSGFEVGDVIGCDYRTDSITNLQPWVYHHDPRGVILGWDIDHEDIKRLTPKLVEETYPGYMRSHAPVQWTFDVNGVQYQRIYVERIEAMFHDGSPPPDKDWTKFQGKKSW